MEGARIIRVNRLFLKYAKTAPAAQKINIKGIVKKVFELNSPASAEK